MRGVILDLLVNYKSFNNDLCINKHIYMQRSLPLLFNKQQFNERFKFKTYILGEDFFKNHFVLLIFDKDFYASIDDARNAKEKMWS